MIIIEFINKQNAFFRKTLNGQVINSTQAGNLDSVLPIKIFIHGFFHHGSTNYMIQVKDTFLRNENVNVILTDWSKGLVLFISKNSNCPLDYSFKK